METRKIGGLTVSAVGVGCNNFGKRVDAAGTRQVVSAALDAGINFFDTADIYGGTLSEGYLGQALAGRRQQAVLATKFGMAVDPARKGARPDYVRQAVEASLKRLGTDYIDLYQLHQPDPDTPIADTLATLDELVRSGKVREIGCSNFSADQLDQAMAAVGPGSARFASLQNEYSLLRRAPEADVLPACARHGVAFIPFFPLASGLLTGKYRGMATAPSSGRFGPGGWGTAMYSEENLVLVDALHDYAASIGMSMLELAFSWLLSRTGVASVIAGAMTPDQARANAGSFKRSLSATELDEVASILTRKEKT